MAIRFLTWVIHNTSSFQGVGDQATWTLDDPWMILYVRTKKEYAHDDPCLKPKKELVAPPKENHMVFTSKGQEPFNPNAWINSSPSKHPFIKLPCRLEIDCAVTVHPASGFAAVSQVKLAPSIFS